MLFSILLLSISKKIGEVDNLVQSDLDLLVLVVSEVFNVDQQFLTVSLPRC